jgi:hypothetical protein
MDISKHATEGAREKRIPPKPDKGEILQALRFYIRDGKPVELRVLNARTPSNRYPHTVSGYFDDAEKLANAAIALDGAPGIYITINPVDPALLARARNRAVDIDKRGTTTQDNNIPRRRFLPIDFDAVRPTGISSTDAEHNAAIERAKAAQDWLRNELGFPAMIRTDSGNGSHLTIPIDLPGDDGGLVNDCIHAIKARFADDAVEVDEKVGNASRILKLPGTVSRKGEDDPDRPHRVSRILEAPDELVDVPVEKLKALAAMAPKAAKKASAAAGQRIANMAGGNGFDLEGWARRCGVSLPPPDIFTGEKGHGLRYVFDICPWNPEHSDRSFCIIKFDGGGVHAACHHKGCTGKGWKDFRAMHDVGWRDDDNVIISRRSEGSQGNNVHFEREDGGETVDNINSCSPRRQTALLTRMADVVVEQVKWLWASRLPCGKLTMLAGYPGDGKSILAMDLAARVSTGAPMPGETERREPGDVLLLLAEDGMGDTVAPRLRAAGADLSRCHALTAVETRVEGTVEKSTFNFAQDMEALRDAIERLPNCQLVIVDTINSYLGGKANSDKDAEVRQILLPLTDLAGEKGVAVLAISHLNKRGEGKAVNRIMGSLAFVGVARVAFMLGKDEQNAERRILAPIKCNIGKMPKGIAFSIGDGPKLVWETEQFEHTADDLLNAEEDAKKNRKSDEVADWIEEMLADGPRLAVDMIGEAKSRDFSKWATDAACKKLNVTRGRPRGQYGGKMYWAMPRHVVDGQVSLSPVESGPVPCVVKPYSTVNDHPIRDSEPSDHPLRLITPPPVEDGPRTRRTDHILRDATPAPVGRVEVEL